MFPNLQSKHKLAFASFTASFVLFLSYLLLDDFLFGEEIRKELRAFVWIRLGVGLSFSIVLGFLTYFLINLSFKSLKSISQLLQNWSQDVYEDSGESERGDELGELARHFRIALYQKKTKEETVSQESLNKKERELSDKIQKFFHKIRLHKIKNLDITVFPRSSDSGESDYANIIPTADGCFGVLAGFPNHGAIESSFKARIEGMISLAQETTGLRGEDLLYKIDRALRSTPISYLNLTLFYLETRNGEAGILQFQKLPALVQKSGKTNILPISKQVFYDFRSSTRDVKKIQIRPGEYLVFLSDRLTELTSSAGVAPLLIQLQNWSAGRDYKNSRELTLDFGRFLEMESGKKGLSKAAILTVGRVRD
ncbi:Arg-Lys translocation region protein phosphatase RktP [Leptospira haakeii]|uniref:Arg-Lys translocation region protein phosphatase n=1 Tax=Leptospira haakeii TaxID=2023198 RepID=A0ABX4PIV9_9LEPT|nr:Arg-Lys translocation region protein phosphatase RktP [Leptospira haakeii]PKA15271.1 Arg-Lys translocation region protein phosphatase [Leptospira haakeii]PKA18116.1 Arg-Lys translocation region protein phosphatase [Leptospira haakeii]